MPFLPVAPAGPLAGSAVRAGRGLLKSRPLKSDCHASPATVKLALQGRHGARAPFTLRVSIVGAAAEEAHGRTTARAGQVQFHASGRSPCTHLRGQTADQCDFGVAPLTHFFTG